MVWIASSLTLLAMTARVLPPALQGIRDLVQHLGILDGGGHGPCLAVGDLLDGAAQDLARACFRKASDGNRKLEPRHRTELLTPQRHGFLFDLGLLALNASLQHQEA